MGPAELRFSPSSHVCGGARPCTAIDIDEWCVRNSIENIELNHVDDIAVSEGDASSLAGKRTFRRYHRQHQPKYITK